ncbi:Rieske 2Fe-2S domain-containing protein [Pseudooceanicola sp. 216_PA32_1]|uniref:Rieske 2Fe-2S domain-containing protein n=2 Tax=Pseudooceanicola pacificus TaxID=2676438 RepID=A0A844WDH6_9RHOB|nr:Rieske 2Fe-2S domain-containing protein [Pseudooceanicola pacificus]
MPAGELPEGAVRGIDIGDLQLAAFNVAGAIHVTDNVCTHAYALLSEGFLEDNVIECPLHGGQFDVVTGKALCDPAECDLKVYPVRVEGGQVWVDLS